MGTKLTVDGGTQTEKSNVAANTGTQITISNLFYNTPARKKFLSAPNVEKNNVSAVVQKLILSNPGVEFCYTIDGGIVYNYRGKSLIDAVKVVYGDDIDENLIDLGNITSQDGLVSLSGFISKPYYTKRNRTYQTVNVNGRTVEGGIIADTANEVYTNFMVSGNFPFFVLNITVDPRETDVNIHPRKIQIRFGEANSISDFIRQAVTDVLDAALHKEHIGGFSPKTDSEIIKGIKYFSSAETNKVKSAPHILNKYDDIEQARIKSLFLDTKNDTAQIKSSKNPQEESLFSDAVDFKILGTVFDTYILLLYAERLLIIDQHAAHERLLYDKLKAQIDSTETISVQRLLEPILIVLNAEEMNKMECIALYLNKMGIECEQFGTNCFRITAISVLFAQHGIETVIGNLLADIKNTRIDNLSDIIQEKIIMQCCKNAIKAGQSLNNDQIKAFLTQFRNSDKVGLTCPHGRPVVVSYTREQIEKMFARK
jgi:DNA mismatch repair protein MutL